MINLDHDRSWSRSTRLKLIIINNHSLKNPAYVRHNHHQTFVPLALPSSSTVYDPSMKWLNQVLRSSGDERWLDFSLVHLHHFAMKPWQANVTSFLHKTDNRKQNNSNYTKHNHRKTEHVQVKIWTWHNMNTTKYKHDKIWTCQNMNTTKYEHHKIWIQTRQNMTKV